MFSITDLAEKVGQPVPYVCWAVRSGLIPGPDISGHKRKYYSWWQFTKAARRFKPARNGKTAAEIARLLDITNHRFQRWVEAGELPAPSGSRGKRQIWSDSQVEQIQKLAPGLLMVQPKEWRKQQPEGLFSQARAADKLNMPRITFQTWVSSGAVPKPTRVASGWPWKFYNASDLDRIRKKKAGYFAERKQKGI